jgi:hypothetical protein
VPSAVAPLLSRGSRSPDAGKGKRSLSSAPGAFRHTAYACVRPHAGAPAGTAPTGVQPSTARSSHYPVAEFRLQRRRHRHHPPGSGRRATLETRVSGAFDRCHSSRMPGQRRGGPAAHTARSGARKADAGTEQWRTYVEQQWHVGTGRSWGQTCDQHQSPDCQGKLPASSPGSLWPTSAFISAAPLNALTDEHSHDHMQIRRDLVARLLFCVRAAARADALYAAPNARRIYLVAGSSALQHDRVYTR